MLIIKYINGNPYIYARVFSNAHCYWVYAKAGTKITNSELLGLARKIKYKVPKQIKKTHRNYDTCVISSLYTALFFSAAKKQMLL